MKRLAFLMFLFLGLSIGNSYSFPIPSVPETVQNSFSNHFQTVKSLKWNKYKDLYEARFIDSESRDGRVVLNAKGEILSVDQQISYSELPPDIALTLDEEHGDAEIKIIYKTIEGGKTNYLVLLEKEGIAEEVSY